MATTSSRSVSKSLPLVLVMAGLLSACGGLGPAGRYQGAVLSTGAANVASCQYLGGLRGHSGLTGLFAPQGVDNVRQSLLKQADAMGATHVVWAESSALRDDTSLTGSAYACPPAAQ